jgi:hypothetical protein
MTKVIHLNYIHEKFTGRLNPKMLATILSLCAISENLRLTHFFKGTYSPSRTFGLP